MQPRRLALLAAFALVLTPAALGHVPAGTPKTYCEWVPDAYTHDYGPSPGNATMTGLDDYNLHDCDNVFPPADFDGHREFANGGARLHADIAATTCYGGISEHPSFPIIQITDNVHPSNVLALVAIDSVDLTGALPCGDGVMDADVPCIDLCAVGLAPGLDGAYHVFVVNGQYNGVSYSATSGHIETW